MTDLELYDEQLVLATLLERPEENRWELDGLTADIFDNPVHREIALALLEVRNSGRKVHWRRVRRVLRARKQREAWVFVRTLVQNNGLEMGLTAAVSRLVQRRATKRAA